MSTIYICIEFIFAILRFVIIFFFVVVVAVVFTLYYFFWLYTPDFSVQCSTNKFLFFCLFSLSTLFFIFFFVLLIFICCECMYISSHFNVFFYFSICVLCFYHDIASHRYINGMSQRLCPPKLNKKSIQHICYMFEIRIVYVYLCEVVATGNYYAYGNHLF